jgi:hypothetical protein
MRLRFIALLATAGLLGALAVPAFVSAAAVVLVSDMSGKKEIPGPGDKDGRGAGEFKLKAKRGRVCFLIEYEKIQAPFAGHIHKGDKANAGPIKVTLFDDPDGARSPIEGCAKKVKSRLIRRIAKDPKSYYVNLHNEEFPDGAIRGQLKLAPGA